MSEEKYGFRVGQTVRLISGGGKYPLYGLQNGKEYTVFGFDGNLDVRECIGIRFGENEGYASKSQIEPVANNTKVTGPATITVAAGETITFEGNATVKQDSLPKFGDRVVFVNPPEDMVGEFGIVLDNDGAFHLPYYVAYNDGSGCNRRWVETTEIKPYEAE